MTGDSAAADDDNDEDDDEPYGGNDWCGISLPAA